MYDNVCMCKLISSPHVWFESSTLSGIAKHDTSIVLEQVLFWHTFAHILLVDLYIACAILSIEGPPVYRDHCRLV